MPHPNEIKIKDEISGNTGVPLKLVWPTIVLSALIIGEWMDLRYEVRQSVSIQQAQSWIDDFRDANRNTVPAMFVPRLPEKTLLEGVKRETTTIAKTP